MRNFEKGVVYYNPRTGFFSQYRGNGDWGGMTAFYRDAHTIIYNEKSPPPWYIHDELIAFPHPIECSILAKIDLGFWVSWVSRVHKDNTMYISSNDWTSYNKW